MGKFFLFIGRLCISLVFIVAAIGTIFNWEASYQYFLTGLATWLGALEGSPQAQHWMGWLLSIAPLVLVVGTVIEAMGGILVLTGWRIRSGALLLLLFLIPATLLMHPFWIVAGDQREMQMILCMKNFSIIGGLLILAVTSQEGKA
jgi:putative oxidoreductase